MSVIAVAGQGKRLEQSVTVLDKLRNVKEPHDNWRSNLNAIRQMSERGNILLVTTKYNIMHLSVVPFTDPSSVK